jgi:hypothetical protein
VGLEPAHIAPFVNDSIVRTLAGLTISQRPLFLKVAYNGADALAELVEHDRSLVVGILGGAAGTTRDTFELLHRVHALGARVALFGRKIKQAESQLDLVRLMPRVLRGELSPEASVRAYHETLGEVGVTPMRSLEADLAITDPVLVSEQRASSLVLERGATATRACRGSSPCRRGRPRQRRRTRPPAAWRASRSSG